MVSTQFLQMSLGFFMLEEGGSKVFLIPEWHWLHGFGYQFGFTNLDQPWFGTSFYYLAIIDCMGLAFM